MEPKSLRLQICDVKLAKNSPTDRFFVPPPKIAVSWRVIPVLLLAACVYSHRPPESCAYTLGHATLMSVAGTRRFIEPRISGLSFAPWPRHGIPPSNIRNNLKPSRLREAAAQISRELKTRRTPSALGAAGALKLLSGEPFKALALLDEATAGAPNDTRLLVDKAAALLEADKRIDLAADVAAVINRLSGVSPDREGTAWHFNRALLLERLGLTEEAGAAFRLAANGDAWSEEATERAIQIEHSVGTSWGKAERNRLLEAATRGDEAAVKALVERWPLAASTLVEEEVLGSLIEPDSALRLLQAELIAQALAQRGDAFLLETIAALHRRPELARAHSDYTRGRFLQRDGQLEEAQILLDRSAGAFTRAGSPFSALAGLRWASCSYQRGQYKSALQRVQAALADISSSHTDIQARLEWLAGLLEIARGAPAAGLNRYQQALDLYKQADSEEGIATVEMLLAEAWQILGQQQEAWRHRRRALQLLPHVSDPERQRTILDEAAEASFGDGLLDLASILQDRVVESARDAANTFALPIALSQRARIRGRRNDHDGARADLDASRHGIEGLRDNAFRSHLMLHLLTIEARVLLESDPERAIGKFNAVSVQYQRMERWVSLRTTLLERARGHILLGREAAALTDLKLANDSGERTRSQDSPESVRAAQDEQGQPLYNELVRLELSRGRTEEAFGYSEKARARRLADALVAEPISLHSLRSSLPPATALVAYHDLGSRLVAFLIRKEGVVVLDLPRIGLEGEVEAVRRFLKGSRSRSRWRTPLAALDARLIAPLRSQLGGIKTIVVVPHRELFMVPFGALYNATTSHYLIEDYRLLVAPSTTVFRTALERSAVLARRRGKVLVAAVAIPPRGLAPLLAPLQYVKKEAREVAAAHPESQLLEGHRVTKEQFHKSARVSSVVHFAGHAVVSTADPTLSFLVLGSPSDATGVLYAHEIANRPMPLTQLVFLSACSTAQGSMPNSEGVQGLARAFLAAGVPAVIGTQWPVEDRVAHDISVRFHRDYARGLDPASALRKAQLSFLAEEPGSFPTWAAFEVIGGVTETIY